MGDSGSGLVPGHFRTLFGRGTLVGMSEGLLLDRGRPYSMRLLDLGTGEGRSSHPTPKRQF